MTCPVCDNFRRVLDDAMAWIPCPACGYVCPDCHGDGAFSVDGGQTDEACPCTDPTDAAHNYREAPNHA